jgi:ABC-type amino acid transport substrate-binding protein
MTAPIEAGVLTLCCSSLASPPLFWTDGDGIRHGYEVDAAVAVAEQAGLQVRWIFRQWAAFRPALDARECDAIWCGSAITPERQAVFSYTKPYAVFDESVVVRPDCTAQSPSDLHGLRVAAIEGSTNMALATTFPGVQLVAFDGRTDDILGDMLRALRAGDVDAVVDDDVCFVEPDPTLRVAFTVPTRNPWGAACRHGDLELVSLLDTALHETDLRPIWQRWLPTLAYPF